MADRPPNRVTRYAQRRLPDHPYDHTAPAYFVTICAHEGTSPFHAERIAKVGVDSLLWLREHRGVLIFAYCLMPDHLHVLLRITKPGTTLPELMARMKSFTTNQSHALGLTGPLWQARYYDHIVRRVNEARSVAAYTLQNPERKGLVKAAEEYRWSGTPDII